VIYLICPYYKQLTGYWVIRAVGIVTEILVVPVMLEEKQGLKVDALDVEYVIISVVQGTGPAPSSTDTFGGL
jgi:hypothetical protein